MLQQPLLPRHAWKNYMSRAAGRVILLGAIGLGLSACVAYDPDYQARRYHRSPVIVVDKQSDRNSHYRHHRTRMQQPAPRPRASHKAHKPRPIAKSAARPFRDTRVKAVPTATRHNQRPRNNSIRQ